MVTAQGTTCAQRSVEATLQGLTDRTAPGAGDPAGRITLANFFAQNIASGASGLECAVLSGATSVLDSNATLGLAS